MLVFVPLFLSGMLLALLIPKLISPIGLWIISLLSFLFIILYYQIKTKRWIFLALAALGLGFTWFTYHAKEVKKYHLPTAIINKTITIKGSIVSLPILSNGQYQFQFKMLSYCQQKLCTSLPLKLSLTFQDPPQVLAAGQLWQFSVKLKPPHGYANPGSFDKEALLFQQSVQASGYVITTPISYSKNIPHTTANQMNADYENLYLGYRSSLVNDLNEIRQKYDEYILQQLINTPFAGVIDALTVGNSSAISTTQWEVFRNTGTTHLIAISGLHIGMIAALFYFLFNYVWRWSAYLCLWLPAQKAAAIFAILGAALYTLFSGYSIPAQRTLIMIIAWFLSLLISRYSLTIQRFFLGLLLVLLINPLAIMNMGFWLSFSAIALLGYGMQARLSTPTNLWWRFGRVQWVATIGLMPLSWLLFQQTSIVGIFANVIAIPWVSWVTVPLALLGCALAPLHHQLGGYILVFSEKTLEYVWIYLNYLSQLPWHSWYLSFNTPWIILSSMIAILLLLAPTAFPSRWLACLWFLPAIAIKPVSIPNNAVKLTVLDVGQGLASVIQTRHHVLIYDTGMGYEDGYNMGDVVVLPFLRYQHIYRLDKMVISHGDADHIGGAAAILRYYPDTPVLTSAHVQFSDPYVSACKAGQHWEWDGVSFTILFPLLSDKINNTINNNSCVLLIRAGDKAILLPGDIEKPAEKKLLEYDKSLLKANILIAPHHGSNTSSTNPFINAVQPNIIIFATGYFNRYRFPSVKVMQRYQDIHSQLYNTAYTGAVTILLQPKQPISMSVYRQIYRHFWSWNAS